MKVSIILPFYNQWILTHKRMFEIYKHAPEYCEVVLINDASPTKDCEAGAAWWQKQAGKHKILYYKNPKNLGFGGSMNKGAEIATGDILVFLSNDVIIRGDVFSAIVEKIQQSENILIGGQVLSYDTGWNVVEGRGAVPYCAGWLIACTRDVWDRLGGFDPIYSPYDYDDIDLSTTAQFLGIKLVALNSPFLHHLSGVTIRSTGADRLSVTQKHRILWLSKWQDEWDNFPFLSS